MNMITKAKYTYGENNIKLCEDPTGKYKLTIGSFCSIAGFVEVWVGGYHNTNWATTYPFGHINQNVFNSFSGIDHPRSKGDVTIGNDVWIAENVVIMSGVTVGDGAILANNSHIIKDVEPYSIVGGNPAKLIKKRFSDDQISKLLKLKWWNLDDKIINEIIPLLCSANLDPLFKKFNL